MSGVAIIGIGMHAFGRTEGMSGMDQGVVAARRALADAGLRWSDIEFAVGGSMQGPQPDSMVSRLGLTGLPFTNVVNGCATGGTALATAANAIESGRADVAITIGFDKHERGAFRISSDSKGPDWYGGSGLALTTQFFGMKITRYMHQYGISQSTLAKVAEKAFRNGSLNPMAWRRKPLSEQEVLDSAMLSWPLTQYMFCSPGEGGVALILCDAKKATQYTEHPVYLRASVMRTRRYGSFEVLAPSLALEHNDGPTADASRDAYEAAGIGPSDVDVAQLQDTESGAEVMHMAENGFCEHGEQEAMIQAGDTEIGGRLPINTDGGCLANGEPIGASGLRQVCESVLQLRGDAGERQVPGHPQVAYTHVYGAPGISAVTVLTR
ncbi:MAG TPA: thiolase family protein [Acidimicrobiales bacterium]